jgi:hypothetical protein
LRQTVVGGAMSLLPVSCSTSRCAVWVRAFEMLPASRPPLSHCQEVQKLRLNSKLVDRCLPLIPMHFQELARFKFVLSIENARTLDYVTEKFWQPLFAGIENPTINLCSM